MANILLVDDDGQVRTVLKNFLQIGGHDVAEAENGRQALGILANRQTDVLITDIVMPEADGFELIMEIARKQPSIKIIAITGGSPKLGQQMLLGIAQKMPVSLVLAKPVTCNDLLAAVEEVL